MPAYFSLGTRNSEFVSQRYLHINNCGFCEELDRTNVSRPQGRIDYQLIYVKSGQLELEANGKWTSLTGGNTYLYRPGTPQQYRIRGITTTFFWIHFTGTSLPDLLSALPDGHLQTGELPEFERFCKTFYAACRTSLHPNMLYYEGLLICLFAKLSEKALSSIPPQASKIRPALIAMNQGNHPRLSNDQLAQRCGLSRYYFIKLFKAATGQTPQQYYTQQAVETAQALLENTDYSVAQIAALCGIDDCFYFSRVFKKHTGVCPADYRKGLQ